MSDPAPEIHPTPPAVNRRRAMSLLGVGSAAAVALSAVTASPARADTDESTPVKIINVADHGATGDGSTDDTAAIQAAITAAGPGDAIYFPAGTYLVTDTLRPGADQTYFGIGNTATIKAKPGGSAFIMVFARRGPVIFDHLNFDLSKDEIAKPGNANNMTALLIQRGTADSARAEIIGCDIRNAYGKGIHYNGDDVAESNLIVRDTTITNCGNNGITMSNAARATIISTQVDGCNSGVASYYSRNFSVSDCVFTNNNGHGFVAVYSQDWHVDRCQSIGNDSWGICAGGLFKDPPPAVNSDFTITNNRCVDNGAGGITLDPTLRQAKEVIQDQRARVSGNLCQGGGIHGINVTHGKNVVVTDNVCQGNTHTGIQVSSSSHVMVASNICYDNAYGLGISSNDVVEDPGHHIIGINMLHSNTEMDLHDEHYRSDDLLQGVRMYGLHGTDKPEGKVIAHPGTLYEWHSGDEGRLYVKKSGHRRTGWIPVKEQPGADPTPGG